MQITPEQARAELERRRMQSGPTPEQARAELRRRQSEEAGRQYQGMYRTAAEAVPGLGRIGDAIPRSFNLQDELAGLAANVATRGRNFRQGTDLDPNIAGAAAAQAERDRIEQRRSEEPARMFAEEAAGQGVLAMLSGGTSLGAGIGQMAARAPVATAAGLGALEGAVSGAGAGQGTHDRMQSAAGGALVGGVTGGALAGSLSAASRMLPGAGRRAIPEIDQLQAVKRQAYQQVDDLGARYSRDSVDGLTGRIRENAQRMSLNPARHPAAASMIDSIDQVLGEGDVSLTALDQLRQVIRRDVASAADPAERAFGQMMVDQVDEYIQGAGVGDMIEGSAGSAASAIMAARSANQRFRKSELVADAIERAQLRAASTGSGGNEENAIRQNLRRLIEPNSRTRNFFTQEERDLIQRAVEGDTIQNALRLVSRLAPSSGGLSAMLGIGGVASVPGVAFPAMAAGEAARWGGGMRQGAMIDDVERLIRTGARTAPPSPKAGAVGVGAGLFGGQAARANAARLEEERNRIGSIPR